MQSLIGLITLLIGIFLFFGNVTGSFPTIPFAGGIVMSIGGAIITSSKD